MTPLMLMVFRMPPTIAIGTSMMMYFSPVYRRHSGTYCRIIVYWYILMLVPAAVVGATIGVKINQRFSSDALVVLLRTVLFTGIILDFTNNSLRSARMEVKIYHTNDIHSALHNYMKFTSFIKNKRRQFRDNMFYVDIGDHVDRSHPYTEATLGKGNIELLNNATCDVATLGNNEGITLTKISLSICTTMPSSM